MIDINTRWKTNNDIITAAENVSRIGDGFYTTNWKLIIRTVCLLDNVRQLVEICIVYIFVLGEEYQTKVMNVMGVRDVSA